MPTSWVNVPLSCQNRLRIALLCYSVIYSFSVFFRIVYVTRLLLASTTGIGPCSSNSVRWKRLARKKAAAPCCLPLSERRRPLQPNSFEAQSHSLYPRCLRFTDWISPNRCKTRFQLVAILCWAGCPAGSLCKVSTMLHRPPPCQNFAWRTPTKSRLLQTVSKLPPVSMPTSAAESSS